MGYSTTYKLTWKPIDSKKVRMCNHPLIENAKFCPECGVSTSLFDIDDVIDRHIDERKRKSSDYMYGVMSDGSTNESCKWYEHEKEMRDLSLVFPQVLFTLHGAGEESGDIWQKYFLNGKLQVAKAKISFDEFDNTKLK